MFTKIDIKKFGLYRDFTWHPVKMKDFGQVNIIYGRNYSGKTTLSRVFDSVSLGKLHDDYLDGEFELADDTGKKIHADQGFFDPFLILDHQSGFGFLVDKLY